MQIMNQQETSPNNKRYGEFSLIVEAENDQAAIDLFRERIVKFRQTSDFFEGDCSVFFTELLEFEKFPEQEAVMINYKSYAGDPILPFIGCTVPSEGAHGCRIYEWGNNGPEIDGKNERLFLEFKAGS
jgi:hypothetical protein